MRLIHALQVEPRASWATLGRVLEIDPGALARRWSRLSADGVAWVAGHRRSGEAVAMVEIECAGADPLEVARDLARAPAVQTVDVTSGERDLVAVVAADDLQSMSEFLLGELRHSADVARARTHPVTAILVEGSSWRLDALTPDEVRRIPRPRPPRARAARHVPDDLAALIYRELLRDGRAAARDIGAKAGVHHQRVTDAIATLRDHGDFVLRTDVARGYTKWPISAWYFLRVPATQIDRLRASLPQMQHVRLALTVAGRYNVILGVWVRTLAEVSRFEVALEKNLPGALIEDRAVVLRPAIHSARLIDDYGRAVRFL